MNIKEFSKFVKIPAKRIVKMDENDVLDHVFTLVTDLTQKRKEKLDLVSNLFVKLYLHDKAYFYKIFVPFFDFLRNNPDIDLFSRLLSHKQFNTTHLSNIILDLMGTGVITVFDIKSILPNTLSKSRKLVLLGRLLKKAQEGIMRDTVVDIFIDVLMPGDTFAMDPQNFMNLEFMNKMVASLSQLAFFYRKGYPVNLILSRIGEQQGPQMVLFVVLMLSQGIMNNDEVRELLESMENPMFSKMFWQAKENMESMMPPGMQGMNVDLSRGMSLGGGKIPGLGGNSIFKKIGEKLFKLFGRFGKK